jgi:protein TonB
MKQLFALAAVIAVAYGVSAQAQPVYSSRDEVVLPVVLKSVKPQYTQEAMKERVQGTALLDCVVLADGRVGEVSVTQSLDSTYGLDEQAVAALRQWEFKPGTYSGKPVAVRVSVEMSFTLK